MKLGGQLTERAFHKIVKRLQTDIIKAAYNQELEYKDS